jgi:glycosyltransferase involved in cell wall biosynthesis
MRICVLCYRGNPYCGGQGVYLFHLSRSLAEQGHEVTMVVGPPYPDPTPWARVVKVPNQHFWGKRRGFLPSERPLSILAPLNFFEFATSRLGYFPEILAFSFRAFRAFRSLNHESPFDVLHDVETLGYGLLLARAHGVPAVSTVHHPLSRDMAAHVSQSGSWRERYYNVVFFPLLMQGFVARRIEGMITSSRVGQEELVRAFGVRPTRVHLVYTGIDLDTFSPDPSVHRDPSEILFVGNAQDPRKGMRDLLDALRSLPSRVRLTVVDEGEPAKTYAPGLVRAMGLSHRVVFTGRLPLEELVGLYRRAGVLVLPSQFEGFGLPVAEAMGCATPVVAGRAGSLPEVVGEDQEGGLLVPPRDPGALGEAVHRVLTQPERAREMGLRARHRVENRFSWERTAQRTAEVYRWAIETAGNRQRAIGN